MPARGSSFSWEPQRMRKKPFFYFLFSEKRHDNCKKNQNISLTKYKKNVPFYKKNNERNQKKKKYIDKISQSVKIAEGYF